MDSIAMCQQTLDAARKVIGGVKQDDLAKPTPCSEWNVRALVNHMIGVNYAFTQALAGKKIETGGETPDLVGDDPAASYAKASRGALEAWRAPGALDRILSLPPGDVPGSTGINIFMTDQSVHTWDLARALGKEHAIDTDLVEVSFEMLRQILRPEFRATGGPFGPEVPCAADAAVQDRLLAFTGRNPEGSRQYQGQVPELVPE
jgi:uncharacterized protein (TIGR03086 family)